MPPTQDNCRQGSPCTDQQPPFSLLPPFEFEEPQLNSQALYLQLISSLCGNSLSEFAKPSCIDPRWLHDPSTTVGMYPSATCHLLYPDDQRQAFDFNPYIPEISNYTFSDPDKILPSDSMYSGINRFDFLEFSNSRTLDPRVLDATSSRHGEEPLNYKHLSSNGTLRKPKRRSDMKEPENTRAPKRRRFSPPYSEKDAIKLPYLGNFRCVNMNKRKKFAHVDNSPPSPHQMSRADKGQDKVDTFSQDKPKPEIPNGDAVHAILEIPKRDLVVSKEVMDKLYATKNRVAAGTTSK